MKGQWASFNRRTRQTDQAVWRPATRTAGRNQNPEVSRERETKGEGREGNWDLEKPICPATEQVTTHSDWNLSTESCQGGTESGYVFGSRWVYGEGDGG